MLQRLYLVNFHTSEKVDFGVFLFATVFVAFMEKWIYRRSPSNSWKPCHPFLLTFDRDDVQGDAFLLKSSSIFMPRIWWEWVICTANAPTDKDSYSSPLLSTIIPE